MYLSRLLVSWKVAKDWMMSLLVYGYGTCLLRCMLRFSLMYLHQVTIYCWWNQIDIESRNNIQVAVAELAPLTGRTDDHTGRIWRSQSSSFRTYRSDRWRTYTVITGNIRNTMVVHRSNRWVRLYRTSNWFFSHSLDRPVAYRPDGNLELNMQQKVPPDTVMQPPQCFGHATYATH